MGCTRKKVPGALVHTYPIDRSGSFYNSTYVQDPESFDIRDVEYAYGERKLPFAIILPRLIGYEKLGDSLGKLGYSMAPPWMLMTLNELTGEGNPEIRVEKMPRSRLRDWFELQDAFPQVESSKSRRRRMVEKLSGEKSAQLLLASIGTKSVGAGLLFIKDRIASIHMIATLNAFRRRHVATTVTLEAIRHAEKDDPEFIWLRTRRGGTGEKVYSKIGFGIITDILCYTKTPQCEDCNLPPK